LTVFEQFDGRKASSTRVLEQLVSSIAEKQRASLSVTSSTKINSTCQVMDLKTINLKCLEKHTGPRANQSIIRFDQKMYNQEKEKLISWSYPNENLLPFGSLFSR
jgi:hypothetical protein